MVVMGAKQIVEAGNRDVCVNMCVNGKVINRVRGWGKRCRGVYRMDQIIEMEMA